MFSSIQCRIISLYFSCLAISLIPLESLFSYLSNGTRFVRNKHLWAYLPNLRRATTETKQWCSCIKVRVETVQCKSDFVRNRKKYDPGRKPGEGYEIGNNPPAKIGRVGKYVCGMSSRSEYVGCTHETYDKSPLPKPNSSQRPSPQDTFGQTSTCGQQRTCVDRRRLSY